MYTYLADIAGERIFSAITKAGVDDKKRPVLAILDSYNPVGSTIHVNFNTSKTTRWKTDSRKCHINWVIWDSDWEQKFCGIAEEQEEVIAYAKNQGLGFEVPYQFGAVNRTYIPDFIVLIDDGHGPDNPLHLIVEIKGIHGEDAKQKKLTMESFWVSGVNNLGTFGRWAFAEYRDPYTMEEDFKKTLKKYCRAVKNG
jgi:type III restriction enzyme